MIKRHNFFFVIIINIQIKRLKSNLKIFLQLKNQADERSHGSLSKLKLNCEDYFYSYDRKVRKTESFTGNKMR